jgi:hypothetical protein
MSTTTDDSPSTASPEPRAGFTWVDAEDGVAGHWERERANAQAVPPTEATSDPRVTPPTDHDDDHEGKKHKGHKKHHDKDDDDDHDSHRDKKHKKHDKDDDDDHDEDQSNAAPVTTPTPPPSTAPPGPGPVVRDHRDGDPANSPGGVTVRDHRGTDPTPSSPFGTNVRDHRGEDPTPAAAFGAGTSVRDHRQETPESPVRDHLADVNAMTASSLDEFSVGPPSAPSAGVRDHRDPPPPAAEIRDHRDPPPQANLSEHAANDLVGDEADVAPAFAIPELQPVTEHAATESYSSSDADDWESPVAATADFDHTVAADVGPLGDDEFDANSSDEFADHDSHQVAGDAEMSAPLE